MRDDWLRRARELSPSAKVATAISVTTVLFLLAAGALGLGWQDQVSLPDQHLSGEGLFAALGAMLGAGIVVIVLSVAFSKGKAPPGKLKGPSPVAMVVQALFLLLWVFAIVMLRDHLGGLFGGGNPRATPTPGALGPRTPPPNAGPATGTTWSWSVAFAAGFVIALVATAIALIVRRSSAADDALDDTPDPEELQRIVRAARTALAEVDDPRAAVIRSYAAMETALADLGTARALADTPTDLLRRADAAGLLTPAGADAADELAQLFERARFSRRDLPTDARYRAVDALNRLEGDLRAAAAAQRDPAGSSAAAGTGGGE